MTGSNWSRQASASHYIGIEDLYLFVVGLQVFLGLCFVVDCKIGCLVYDLHSFEDCLRYPYYFSFRKVVWF